MRESINKVQSEGVYFPPCSVAQVQRQPLPPTHFCSGFYLLPRYLLTITILLLPACCWPAYNSVGACIAARRSGVKVVSRVRMRLILSQPDLTEASGRLGNAAGGVVGGEWG